MPVSGDYARLDRLISGGRGLNRGLLSTVNQAFALSLQYRTDRCFTDSKTPYGESWEPGKSRAGQLLMDTGRLKNSVTRTRATAEAVTISSNVEYAATHNYGRGPIPQRQFLPDKDRGLPPLYRRDLEDTVTEALKAMLGGGE